MLSPNGSDAAEDASSRQSRSILVSHAAHVGDARRQATSLAQKLGFNDTDRGKVSLAVTEAANNLVKHGGGGEILLMPTPLENGGSLDILAIDKGMGMANIAQCLTDGYSTAGTPGTGLGAIQRLSSAFDIYSSKGHGTVLFARIAQETGNRRQKTEDGGLATNDSFSLFDVGAVSVAAPGETECGDGWEVQAQSDGVSFLMVDGLGHGPQAAQAAQAAIRLFCDRADRDEAPGLLDAIHAGLRSTRGAAAAVASWKEARQELVYAGIGNIAGAIVAGTNSQSLVSLSGIVGHQMRRVQPFNYPCPSGALLILHSDGLATQWNLDRYPGLAQRPPAVIAGVLYRDCKRGRDDASVLVARFRKRMQA